MKRALALVAVLTAAAALTVPIAVASTGLGGNSSVSPAKPTTYAVIGDTPYGTAQIENFPNDVAEINADPQVSLIMHLGDIKNGSSQCSTSYYELIREEFDDFADPLVYTPGDNEWTDCHRANNGSYWPAGPVLNGDSRPARLEEIRRVFFDQPGWTLGEKPREVDVQGSDFPENVLWRQSRTQFGVVHVVGSNNDWTPWFNQPRTSSQIAEVERRTTAAIEWLEEIFDSAHDGNAKAIVIGMQADMWDPAIVGDPASHDHFTPIVQALAEETLAFGGPVLLLDGDSHEFVDDHPLADASRPENRAIYGISEMVPNLRRITVNGSTTPCHEWLKLTISPAASHPFSYERESFAKQPGMDPVLCPEA